MYLNFCKICFHKLTLFFLLFVFSLLALINFNQAEAISFDIKECKEPKNFKDIKCRCRKDQCRLSFGDKYACINGSVELSDDNKLPSIKCRTTNYNDCESDNPKFDDFIHNAYTAAYINFVRSPGITTDNPYITSIGEAEGFFYPDQFDPEPVYGEFRVVDGKLGITYTDQYAYDLNRVSVPPKSYCRIEPKSNQAYWYYPNFGGYQNTNGDRVCREILFISKDLFGNNVTGTKTAFGCLPNTPNGLVAFVVRLVTGIALFVTLLIVIINFIVMINNSTNPEKVKASQKNIQNAVTILFGIFFALLILELIGIQIIGIGSSIFNLFTGG